MDALKTFHPYIREFVFSPSRTLSTQSSHTISVREYLPIAVSFIHWEAETTEDYTIYLKPTHRDQIFIIEYFSKEKLKLLMSMCFIELAIKESPKHIEAVGGFDQSPWHHSCSCHLTEHSNS